jgi:hypothetical protein
MSAILRSIPRKTVLMMAALVLLFTGLSRTSSGVCACGGSMDGYVYSALVKLDAVVHEYAAQHNGAYPTYTELRSLAKHIDRQVLNAQLLGYMVTMRAYYGRFAEYLKHLSAEELIAVQAYYYDTDSRDQWVAARELLDKLGPDSVSIALQLFSDAEPQHYQYRTESFYSIDESLTPEVDITTRNFRVPPTDKWGAIGYAVSSNLRAYVLVGAGWGEKSLTFYGIRFFPLGVGVRILRPDRPE